MFTVIMNFVFCVVFIGGAVTLSPFYLFNLPVIIGGLSLVVFGLFSLNIPDMPKLARWQKLDGISDILIATYALMVYYHAIPMVTGIFLAYYIFGACLNLFNGIRRFIAL